MKSILLASLLVSHPLSNFTCSSEKNVFPYFEVKYTEYMPPDPIGHLDVTMLLDLFYTDVFSYEAVVLSHNKNEYLIDYPNGYFYMTKTKKEKYEGIFILYFEKNILETLVTCHFN